MPALAPSSGVRSTVLLRQITVCAFPPACILCVIHGVATTWAFPALGALPLAGSAVLGLLLLYRDRGAAALGSPVRPLSSANVFFADSALAALLLALLVPTWVLLGRPYERGLVVLGTYCSVFMMVNL